MKRILLIGSEGNIGSKLSPYLRSQGHEVYRCDQIQQYGKDYTVINILSPNDLHRIFNKYKPEVVFLLAAMVSRVTCEGSPGLTIDTNLSGLNNVIQLCKNYNSRLVYFSTSEVYGNIGGNLSEDRECKPNNIYGLTKYLGEKLVQYFLTDAIIVRPFMFYDEDETLGEHRSAMIRFAENLSKGIKIQVHKDSARSWMHMSDAVIILEKLLNTNGVYIINIGSSEVITMKELAQMMCNYLYLNYIDMVDEIELPDKMTLTKYPDTGLQRDITNIIPEISISYGIKLVIDKVKTRIK
jgi:nucleoside-diphosphate-sugar epimerase